MSDAGILDFAGLDSAADAVEATDVDTPEAGAEVVDTPAAGAEEIKDGEEGSKNNADGTPREKVATDADLPGSKATPQNVRQALKALRDADPKNAAIVKELHGAYERHGAYAKVFAKVSDAVDAKTFIDSVGGQEGVDSLKAVNDMALASDEMLYAGDPKLIENIVADLKSEGKIEALGKMAPAFLDALKTNDEKGYYAAFSPHFLAGIDKVNLPGAIGAIVAALKPGTDGKISEAAIKEATEVAAGMSAWYQGLKQQAAAAKKPVADDVNPERVKFEAEKTTYEEGKKADFNKGVATEADKYNNRALGKVLAPFLRTAFFKDFPRETLIDLGNGIKSRLFATLKADAVYQKQMDAMWKAKSPDKAKILEYHNAKVDSIAEDIVRGTVQARYPGYAKGGKAAGKAAAAAAKTTAAATVDAAAAATGKPVYVAVKPKWEAIDHDKDPKDLMFIAGKAYLKGSGKLVTWRK